MSDVGHQHAFAAPNLLMIAMVVYNNGFIANSLIRESEEDYLPDINAARIARYLYLIKR
jgi:hypothetical protein